ncbi:MAG TPA: hypothetical protein VH054_02030 [Polyangiaceae bacterium]|nr:hypothetical protein [Polyangiaceae bacterium]
MASESVVPAPFTPSTLDVARDRVGIGRLGTYSALGAAAAAVPLPILPGSLGLRVRGALVHDVCARFGLSITPEARRVLAAPGLAEGPPGMIGAAIRFATTRVLTRLGPLGVIPPVRSALLTYAIGHLLARYLAARTDKSVRVDVDEARRVRRAIERSLAAAFSTSAREEQQIGAAPEELRDPLTQATDGVIAALASLPGNVVRRLEAAFDASIGDDAIRSA